MIVEKFEKEKKYKFNAEKCKNSIMVKPKALVTDWIDDLNGSSVSVLGEDCGIVNGNFYVFPRWCDKIE